MNIGLFFGSFNPVHSGHMVIASWMAEYAGLDQVWMVVTPHNPLKDKHSLLQDVHRLELVRAAIGDHRKLKVSDVEFKLPQPSYTIDTLNHLAEKYPEHRFVVILGRDSLESLPKWKDYLKILGGYALYVYPRVNAGRCDLEDHPRVTYFEAPLMGLSSSFIREALRKKKDVRYMMPESVWRMIEEKGFYQ